MSTRVRQDVVGIRGDECDCGRRASVLHCNVCGSRRIYARSNRQHLHLDGSIKFVANEFRCQTCGHVFIEEERQFCDAPPISEALAKLKVQRLHEAYQRGEYLRPADAKMAEAIEKAIEAHKPQGEPSSSVATNTLSDTSSEATPERDPNFVPPNGLTRAEYDVADRAFRLEWAQKKLMGQDTGITVEEYVERRLKGELFQ